VHHVNPLHPATTQGERLERRHRYCGAEGSLTQLPRGIPWTPLVYWVVRGVSHERDGIGLTALLNLDLGHYHRRFFILTVILGDLGSIKEFCLPLEGLF
jgi:hypothetical protein